jgi:hypothetical protein
MISYHFLLGFDTFDMAATELDFDGTTFFILSLAMTYYLITSILGTSTFGLGRKVLLESQGWSASSYIFIRFLGLTSRHSFSTSKQA